MHPYVRNPLEKSNVYVIVRTTLKPFAAFQNLKDWNLLSFCVLGCPIGPTASEFESSCVNAEITHFNYRSSFHSLISDLYFFRQQSSEFWSNLGKAKWERG